MSLAKSASLRQVFTFHTVARLGSVSLAAEELHLTQSAVSIQIASLEASVGAQLVSRTGRGVRLTDAGTLLLSYADRLMVLWNEASDEIATYLGAFSGTLRVGAVTTAEYWLPRVLVNFVNENPQVKVNLTVGNREEIVRSLAGKDIDIAVMGQPPAELKVQAFSFAMNPMGFMAAPDHALMSDPDLNMAKIADAHLLVRERGSGSRSTVERLFAEAGLRLRIGSEMSSNESIKQMCAAGFGPAYLSLLTCVLELKAGLLKLLPLPNNPIEREWFVVQLAARQFPQVAIAFAQFLRDTGQTEIDAQLAHLAQSDIDGPRSVYSTPRPGPRGSAAPGLIKSDAERPIRLGEPATQASRVHDGPGPPALRQLPSAPKNPPGASTDGADHPIAASAPAAGPSAKKKRV